MKALVFGSLNIDYVYEVDHFVQPGETLSSENLELFCGGKGLNQSIALRRSGVDTWHAGAVGIQDGEMLTDYLMKSGVHTDLILKKRSPSGHAVIQKTPDGENCIILFGGANQLITEKDIDFVMSHFTEEDYLLLQNEISGLSSIMEKAHRKGMKIALNPSPVNLKLVDFPILYADYLILNEIEGAAVTGKDTRDYNMMLKDLMLRFPDSQIVLTLGKDGSVYGYRNQIYRQKVYPAEVVDTTAAGDTFTGFFLGSIMRGKEIWEAMDLASRASAIAVSRSGAGKSIPELFEIKEGGMLPED